MSEFEAIEDHLRAAEVLDPSAALVIRGWPLTVEGLLRNADATRRRYSFRGEPLVAVSAEVTLDGWGVDAILSGPRLRSFASAAVVDVVEAGFQLLPTFSPPHYSVVLANYDEKDVRRLIAVLGEVVANPHHVRRRP